MRTKYYVPLCGCGCGYFVSERKPGVWNRFLPGHNFKIVCLDSEKEKKRREKISKTMKKLIADNPKMKETRRGFLGKTHSSEVKKKLSKASFIREKLKKENGYKVSDEAKQKIAKAATGRKKTDEERKKISRSQKGRIITKEAREKIKQTLIEYYKTHEGVTKNKNLTKEHKNKISAALKGKYRGSKASNWRGGINSFPYAVEWTKWLKQEIKKRDSNICQNPRCQNSIEMLDIHHIDYDKNNCSKINLISICKQCHGKTQHNRKYWKNYYQRIMMIKYEE